MTSAKRRVKVFRGDRLKVMRERMGLSQTEFADQLGLQVAHYGRFELGNAEPSPVILVKIANLIGVSTDWLLGAVDRPERIFPDSTMADSPEEQALNQMHQSITTLDEARKVLKRNMEDRKRSRS